MRQFQFILLFIVLLLRTISWAASWDQRLPLASSDQKARAFLTVNHIITSMTDGAARFGVDPVMLFNSQLQIEDEIATLPIYLDLKNHHQDLISFAVFKEDAAQPTDDKQIQWQQIVQKAHHFVQSRHLTDDKTLIHEINEFLSSPLFSKVQGIVVGLAQLIPPQQKKEFFAATVEQKIQLLQQSLPDEIVSHGFTPSKLGWSDTQITKHEIVSRLQRSNTLEQELLLMLIYVYDLKVSSSESQLNDKDFLQNLSGYIENKKGLEQFFTGQVAKLKPAKSMNAELSLHIVEIPPIIALFRGFAGNDCSTQCSFPFVNSPNEYTFLILDSKGNVKGYAQGARVQAQGLDSLFLHTIAGPRISYDDTLTVLKTFVQQKEKMGFSQVLLPPVNKLEAMINFMPIREAYKAVITTHEIPISYQDEEIRSKLKHMFQLTKTYDDAESNPSAFLINENLLDKKIRVDIGASVDLEKINIQTKKESLIGILLQMTKRLKTNQPMIEALAPHIGMTLENINLLYNASQNYSNLPKAEFIQNFETELKKFEIDYGPGYFNKNISLISRGLLNCPDVVADTRAVEIIIANLLEQREISSVESFLLIKRAFFKNVSISTLFFKNYYNDFHEAEMRSSDVLRVALNENSDFLKNKQVRDSIFRSKKAWEVLTEFYFDNFSKKRLLDAETRALIEVKIRPFTELRSRYYGKLMSSQSETEYIETINEMTAQLKALGGNNTTLEFVKRDLYATTVDHYLTLKPVVNYHTQFMALSRYMTNNELVKKALRRLLPYVLKKAAVHHIDTYLQIASQLKDSADKRSTI
ncbi:MAG: hypothetical protein ACXVCY_17270, partial [Pseudobdellovibrionaceae bacterium]